MNEALTNRVVDYLRTARLPSQSVMLKDASALILEAEKSKGSPKDEVFGLRDVCLAVELYDLAGDYKTAEYNIGSKGQEIRDELRKRTVQPLRNADEVRLFRQKCWVLVHWGNALYRKYQVDEALHVFSDCEFALNAHQEVIFEVSKEAAFGLRSRIAYSQGIAHLRQQNVLEARQSLARSMDLQYQRYQTKLVKYASLPLDSTEEKQAKTRLRDREFRYANYMNAKILGLGLGWASLRAGELLRARATLSCARIMLESTDDLVHKAFVELLYAMTLRAQHSDRRHPDNLQEAITLLRGLAHSNGPFCHHAKYRVRAQYELAHALLDADSDASDIDQLTTAIVQNSDHNRVWPWNVELLKCRRHRLKGELQESSRIATKIIEKAGSGPIVGNALVERAQAWIRLGDPSSGERDAQAARLYASGNPVLAAVCHLLSALCLARQQRVPSAMAELEKWHRYEPRIEHGWILDLADEIEAEVHGTSNRLVLKQQDAFSIKNVSELDIRVKGWLCQQFIAEHGEKWARVAAAQLNVTPKTCFKWAQDAGISTPRGGASSMSPES